MVHLVLYLKTRNYMQGVLGFSPILCSGSLAFVFYIYIYFRLIFIKDFIKDSRFFHHVEVLLLQHHLLKRKMSFVKTQLYLHGPI